MEYFSGSLLTLLTMFVVVKLYKQKTKNIKPVSIKFSQSRLHHVLKPIEIIEKILQTKKPNPSQSWNDYNKRSFKILFVEDYAYWIRDNTFMVAETIDGKILQETAKPVDTMGMNKIELEKMIFIVDKLKEGVTDDRGNSGK